VPAITNLQESFRLNKKETAWP